MDPEGRRDRGAHGHGVDVLEASDRDVRLVDARSRVPGVRGEFAVLELMSEKFVQELVWNGYDVLPFDVSEVTD
ncbi:hypothetical protein [Methanopyrus sp.]